MSVTATIGRGWRARVCHGRRARTLPKNLSGSPYTPALLPALLAAFLLGACSMLSPRPVMPISAVVNLKGGPPEQVLSRVRSSRTTYALRGSDFGKLAD